MIKVEHPNGYVGYLKGNGEMTIKRNGEEVLHTYSATPRTSDELYDCLETMPQFMELIKEQEHE